MQEINWYINRLRGMSVREILWRISSLIKSVIDHIRIRFDFLPDSSLINDFENPKFRVSCVEPSCWGEDTSPQHAEWRDTLVSKAEKISENKLSFFDLKNHFFGNPIDWHSDQSSGHSGPVAPIASVNYRDFPKYGDCKLVWEPNRHHHTVVLARAWRATGDKRYALAVVDQITSWMDSNPVGYGMNWRSPLELGIRLINWVWAIDLIWESGLVNGVFKARLLKSVHLHCWYVTRKYSKGSSANNHLVGEAAGVFIAASYFNCFKECGDWVNQSASILEKEIVSQSYGDGCTREQALGYQFFVLQFYLYAGHIGRLNNKAFSSAYIQRMKRMISFVSHMAEGAFLLPMFGDRDDGYVLDLGNRVEDVDALVDCFSRMSGEMADKSDCVDSEASFWMFGNKQNSPDKLVAVEADLTSHAFPESGYYLLQSGSASKGNQVSLLFDCGELGYESIAAHGHADALSFSMRLNKVDLFVDPGTYDYFTFPEWRNYFRSTCAHNTLEIDGLDQSENLGPFMWGFKADSECMHWDPSDIGGKVAGKHKGYARLTDPVVHSRSLSLDAKEKTLSIEDCVSASLNHTASIYFHLSECARLISIENNCCYIDLQGREILLKLDSKLEVKAVTGQEAPIMGWMSRGYHCKEKTTTIIASSDFDAEQTFLSTVYW